MYGMVGGKWRDEFKYKGGLIKIGGEHFGYQSEAQVCEGFSAEEPDPDSFPQSSRGILAGHQTARRYATRRRRATSCCASLSACTQTGAQNAGPLMGPGGDEYRPVAQECRATARILSTEKASRDDGPLPNFRSESSNPQVVPA
jgi:hypothetical protein